MTFNPSGDSSTKNPLSSIDHVCVIGAGLMGAGIATVCAFHGYSVTVVDLDEKVLAKGRERVKFGLAKMLEENASGNADSREKNRLAQILGRIQWSKNLAGTLQANGGNHQRLLIIESIVENLETKKALLAKICQNINPTNGVPLIATNTSSLLIQDIGRDLEGKFKQKFGGLHFFNPVPKMPLIEVIPSAEMQSPTLDQLNEFVKSIGKVPIVCKDTPGFIANRILIPLMAESIGLVERGIASPEEVDKACQLGLGLPIGPFRLLDFVGLDTARNIIQGWVDLYPGEFPNLRQSKMLEGLVKEGKCGRKTGEGFYKYSSKL